MSWCLISGQLYRASWILKILHSLSSCFLVPFAAVDFYVKRSQLWMDLSCLWVLGWLSTGLLSNKTEGIFSFRFRHQYRNISADHKIQISPIAFAWLPHGSSSMPFLAILHFCLFAASWTRQPVHHPGVRMALQRKTFISLASTICQRLHFCKHMYLPPRSPRIIHKNTY